VAENKLSAGTRNEERREEKANWDAKSTCSLETKKSFLVREHGWQLFVCSILDKLSFGNYFAFPLTFLSIDSLHLTSLSLGSPVLLSTFFHSRFFEIFLRRTNHLCFPLYQQVLSSSASPELTSIRASISSFDILLAGTCDIWAASQGTGTEDQTCCLSCSVVARPKVRHFCAQSFCLYLTSFCVSFSFCL